MGAKQIIVQFVRSVSKATQLADRGLRGAPISPFHQLVRRSGTAIKPLSPKPPVTASSLRHAIELANERRALRVSDKKPDPCVTHDDDDSEAMRRVQERRKLTERLTDDTVNSEAKLHAVFLKWLAINEYHHFDVEDENAFKERFGIFKHNARFINKHNKNRKSSSSSITGLNPFTDLTNMEFATGSYKRYPKKAGQVIAGIADYLDKKAN